MTQAWNNPAVLILGVLIGGGLLINEGLKASGFWQEPPQRVIRQKPLATPTPAPIVIPTPYLTPAPVQANEFISPPPTPWPTPELTFSEGQAVSWQHGFYVVVAKHGVSKIRFKSADVGSFLTDDEYTWVSLEVRNTSPDIKLDYWPWSDPPDYMIQPQLLDGSGNKLTHPLPRAVSFAQNG